ncbi:hypothetical protein BDZ97DRAFT_1762690 [Flammula alnicola]|nr:hypothetical protein BDZ97DRAFT_1762690 [Flammula alnicola]
MSTNPGDDSEQQAAKYLPRIIKRQALWSANTGLVTSPNSSRFPPEAPQDRDGQVDYSRPRLLEDAHIYKAFYPRMPLNRGEIFGRLDVSARTLGSKVVEHSEGRGRNLDLKFGLEQGFQDDWYRLESILLNITFYLWQHLKHRNVLPEIDLPTFPNQCGYRNVHRSRQIAVRCALRAQEAFTMLGALLTFILTLGLGVYEHNCFEDAFGKLLKRSQGQVTRPWLTLLKESYICNLSFGLRAGAIIDPYRFNWGNFVPKFVAAGIPLWFVWGDDERQIDVHQIPDGPFKKNLYPPFEVIARAEARASLPALVPPYAPATILPSHWERRGVGPENVHQPENVELETGWLETDSPADTANFFEADTHIDAPAVPEMEIGQPEALSLQKHGEHYEDFFTRVNGNRARTIANDSPREKQSREAMERDADRQVYSPKTQVFLWREEQGFWRRERLTKGEVPAHWDDFTPNQRRYIGHLKQWDLCPMYPRFPDGVERPELLPAPQFIDDDDDDDDDDDGFGVPGSRPSLNDITSLVKPDEAGQYNAVRDVQKLLEDGEFEGQDEPPVYPTDFAVFLDFILNRYGYSADRHRRNDPSLHSTEAGLTPTHVLNGLGHSDIPLPPEWQNPVIDFYKTLVNTRLRLSRFPSRWDISPSSMDAVRLEKEGYILTRYQGPHGALPVYVIRYSQSERGDWAVTVQDPTIVLLIFRNAGDWHGLDGLVRFLLKKRVPFQMPHRIHRDKSGRPARHTPTYGLGGRGFAWVAQGLDYEEYEMRRNALFGSSLGRAFRLMGGIVGRLAEEHVSEEAVLQGPHFFNKVIVELANDYVLAEDDVSVGYQDIVSGVYHVDVTKGGATIGVSSWWPRLKRWEGCGYDLGQWLPDAEQFYQTRLQKIRVNPGEEGPLTSGKWKAKLRFYGSKTKAIMEPGRDVAASFIEHFFEAQRSAASRPSKRPRHQ